MKRIIGAIVIGIATLIVIGMEVMADVALEPEEYEKVQEGAMISGSFILLTALMVVAAIVILLVIRWRSNTK